MRNDWHWKAWLSLYFGLATVGNSCPVLAQLTPDNTLGAEASSVNTGVTIGGQPGDRIEGGARRGVNLFHSFSNFNVNSGQRVYFANPAGVENILNRVTGTSVSNILGTLGVEGTANLFLLNPNGILFGPNAQLDVRGSFVASTASRVLFPNGASFSAVNPEVPSLLTINVPIGLQYGRTPGSIVVNGSSLQVDPGKGLALLGGDVQLQDAALIAPGGSIELGAAVDSVVELNQSNNLFQFNFSFVAQRGNVSTDGASLNTSSLEGNGGSININADSIAARNTLLSSDAFELGNSGSIVINALNNANLNSVNIYSTGGLEAGRGGDIQINSGNLSITNNSLLTSEAFRDGDAGNIVINTRGLTLIGSAEINSSSGTGKGKGGNIEVNTDSLLTVGGTKLDTTLFGEGSSGNVVLNARNNIFLLDGEVSTEVRAGSKGNGGDIRITANNLFMRQSRLQSPTAGEGSAGGVVIDVDGDIYLDASLISSKVERGAIGNAGDIKINSSILTLNNSSYIQTQTEGTGNAGRVDVDVRNSILFNSSVIFSSVPREEAVGNGGDIRISTGTLTLKNPLPGLETQSSLTANTNGRGNSGNIIINARESIFMERSPIFTRVDSNGFGSAGNIEINTGTISTVNSGIVAQVIGVGKAGDININSSDSIIFQGGGAYSDVFLSGVGDGGNINLNTRHLRLTAGAQVFAATAGKGNAGNVTIVAKESVLIDGVETNAGIGFDDRRSSSILNSSEQNAAGSSGKIIITSPFLLISNSGVINAQTKTAFRGGDIVIDVGTFEARSGGQVITTAYNSGQAGNITLNAANNVLLSGTNPNYAVQQRQVRQDRRGDTQGDASGLYANSAFNSTGQSGNIQIKTGSFQLDDGAQIVASTSGQGNAGGIILDTENVTIARGGKILAATDSNGDSGTITISASKAVNLGIGVQDFSPVVSVETSGAGKAGDIIVTTPGLILSDTARITATATATSTNVNGGGSITLNASRMDLAGIVGIFAETQGEAPAGTLKLQPYGNQSALDITLASQSNISASTSGRGNGGDLVLTAPRSINLSGPGKLAVETSSTGNAGSINVATQELMMRDGVELSASTSSSGKAGDINIIANRVSLSEGARVTTNTTSSGQAGNVNLQIRDQSDLTINLTTNSRISASTSDGGNGGGLTFTAPRSITLAGPGQLAVETSSTGNAGNINVTTQQLTMRDGVELSASTSSSGKAGDINITASSVALSGGARVATNTAGSGQAGNLNLQVRDQLQLAGAGTGLFASTTSGSSGNGGNITIDPRTVLIQDRATIAVNSQGQGQGGNISVQSGRLELRDRGSITAETASTQGGNITLNVQDLLLLRRNSLISTTAGTAQAGGNGGNIRISAPFVAGVLSENSDIRANAFTGNGGRVDITAQGIFGLKFQPQDTPRSDITASSQFGISGAVVLNTPGIDPSQGLTELPTNLADPTNQISQVCANRNSANGQANEFVVTGRGGLPPNPATSLGSDEVLVGWVTLPTQPIQNTPIPVSQPESPPVIVEAQGWIVDSEGNVTLVANTETGLAQINSYVPLNCR